MRSLIILGSTGSVGTQALDVARRNPDRFKIVGLSAGTNHELLIGQVREFMPPVVAIADEDAARDLKDKLGPIQGVDESAFDKLIDIYPFEKINDAIEDSDKGKVLKAVLKP